MGWCVWHLLFYSSQVVKQAFDLGAQVALSFQQMCQDTIHAQVNRTVKLVTKACQHLAPYPGICDLLPPLSLARSATWPKEVKAIASQFVGPRTTNIFIGGVEEKLVANKAITQHIKVMSSNFEKLPELQVSQPVQQTNAVRHQDW